MEEVTDNDLINGTYLKSWDSFPGNFFIFLQLKLTVDNITPVMIQSTITNVFNFLQKKLGNGNYQILTQKMIPIYDDRIPGFCKKILFYLKTDQCTINTFGNKIPITAQDLTIPNVPIDYLYEEPYTNSYLIVYKDYITYQFEYPFYSESVSNRTNAQNHKFRHVMYSHSTRNTLKKNDATKFISRSIGKGLNCSSFIYGLSRGEEIIQLADSIRKDIHQISNPNNHQLKNDVLTMIKDLIGIEIGKIAFENLDLQNNYFGTLFSIRCIDDNYFKQTADKRLPVLMLLRKINDRPNCYELREILKGIIERIVLPNVPLTKYYDDLYCHNTSKYNLYEYDYLVKINKSHYRLFTDLNTDIPDNIDAMEDYISTIDEYSRVDLCSSIPIVRFNSDNQRNELKKLRNSRNALEQIGIFGDWEDYRMMGLEDELKLVSDNSKKRQLFMIEEQHPKENLILGLNIFHMKNCIFKVIDRNNKANILAQHFS